MGGAESRGRAGRRRLERAVRGEFGIRRGHPLPYGAAARRDGVNFSVFSKHATTVTLVLWNPGDQDPVLELPLDSRYNRTGDVWHVFVEGIDPGIEHGQSGGAVHGPGVEMGASGSRGQGTGDRRLADATGTVDGDNVGGVVLAVDG